MLYTCRASSILKKESKKVIEPIILTQKNNNPDTVVVAKIDKMKLKCIWNTSQQNGKCINTRGETLKEDIVILRFNVER